MRERGEVTDLGEQSDRGQGVDLAQASQPRDERRPRTHGGLLGDEVIEPVAAGEQHFVAAEVLGERDLHQRF